MSNMNREDIIKLAREANIKQAIETPHLLMVHELERFAALVAAAEREALEKIDWTVLLRQGGLVTWGAAATLADRVIAAIRARRQA